MISRTRPAETRPVSSFLKPRESQNSSNSQRGPSQSQQKSSCRANRGEACPSSRTSGRAEQIPRAFKPHSRSVSTSLSTLCSEAVGRANLHPPTVPSHPSTQPHSASSSREIRLLLDLDAGKASVLLDADIYHRNQHILRVSLRSRHKRRTSSKDVRKLTHSQTTSSSSLPQEQPSRLPEYPTR